MFLRVHVFNASNRCRECCWITCVIDNGYVTATFLMKFYEGFNKSRLKAALSPKDV